MSYYFDANRNSYIHVVAELELEVVKVLYFKKIVYGVYDFKAEVVRNEETIVEIGTEGYCDRLKNADVVVSYDISEEELEEFYRKGYEVLEKAIREGEDIVLEVIDRKLGRCYGNCVWQGIEFERVQESLWKMTTYRGSSSWTEWQDIGMTGTATDYMFCCRESDVYDYIEPFLEDPRTFELDFADPERNAELLTSAAEFADYSCYDIFGFPLSEDESGDIIVYIWDYEGAATHKIYKDRELTEEDKKELIEYFESKIYDDDDLEEVKKIIEESKKLSDFFEKYENCFF